MMAVVAVLAFLVGLALGIFVGVLIARDDDRHRAKRW
jgi:uncharacterized protein YneF (UPF0154 family)